MTANPLYLGCLMIKNGDAGRTGSEGALNTTGNVLRAKFQVVKTKPQESTKRRHSVMLLPENSQRRKGRNTFVVCRLRGFIPDPRRSTSLAEIALSAADTAREYCRHHPSYRPAQSFSNKRPRQAYERVEKVTEATKMLPGIAPRTPVVDGELRKADAALVPPSSRRESYPKRAPKDVQTS